MTWLSHRVRSIILVILLLSVTSPLAYGFYHQIYQKGLQAEARLTFSYLHTLQKVYKIEHGSYVAFGDYGAPVAGQDHCEQPREAAQLGFLIYGCHEENASPPRYSYASREAGSGYLLEAESGSDSERRSLVCFSSGESEHLVSTQNTDFQVRKSCW